MDTSHIAEMLSIVVQSILAIAAIWYTWETRKVRLQNQYLLNITTRQHLITVAPYLLIGVVPKSRFQADVESHPEKFIHEASQEEYDKKFQELRKQISGSPDFYFCTINNPTSKLARDVEVVLYNSENKNFLMGQEGKAIIAEKGTEILWVSGSAKSQQEVIDIKIDAFPELTRVHKELFEYSDVSYAVALFRDIEGSAYAVKRRYVIQANGNIVMWRTLFRML
jgi:hypothetical protein